MLGRLLITPALVGSLGLALVVGSTPAGAAEPQLTYGITGSTPTDPARNPTEMLAVPAVQRLALSLADGPRSRSDVEHALAGTELTVDNLAAVGLVRVDGDQVWLDFNLTLVADQRQILAVTEALGRELAAAVLEHRPELEALAAEHDQPGVEAGEVLYFVLGCMSLDWDGLAVTEDRGWRAGAQRVIDGKAFTPWAKEAGVDVDLSRLYWGSHNQVVDDVLLTTFGDHAALPRYGLPDLLWRASAAFSDFEPDERRAAGRWLSSYAVDRGRDVVAIMSNLRSTSLTRDELARVTGIDDAKLDATLAFLDSAGYLRHSGDRYEATAVVLLAADSDLVDRLVATGHDIIVRWHEANYEDVRRRLSGLTAVENGVPFERLYTQIWHYVFAIANRTLVEEGLFADPYASTRPHHGFLPAVWHESLFDRMP